MHSPCKKFFINIIILCLHLRAMGISLTDIFVYTQE